MITKSFYGNLSDGREVNLYSLLNSHGMMVNIINYGAIVTNIFVKDKHGKLDDVVLGYDSLDGYVQDKSFMGGIVGRYGNRISKGKFFLNDKPYSLSINNGNNHLHGGTTGYHKVLWNAITEYREDSKSVKLTYNSIDGEEGYPGNLIIAVKYSLTENDELKIEYHAETDMATVLNPTHHSYFNLSGKPGSSIGNHQLKINADRFLAVNDEQIPVSIEVVEDTPMDFRKLKFIRDVIDSDTDQMKIGNGFDHNWLINNYNGTKKQVAVLFEQNSGRMMEMYSDQPGLQFYSGNFLDGSIGKSGIKNDFRTGLCLEAQHFPDSPNHPEFPSTTLLPTQTYRQETIYKFMVKD
ncbi:MAG: galactose mutarotase [Ignavibacteriales bacterium]|nr:MAG: galactose mutarotase [Ignavibacteriales bacterium]